jgi:hypothetical protein
MVKKYLSFHNSSFALRYFFNENGKAIVWHTPCLDMGPFFFLLLFPCWVFFLYLFNYLFNLKPIFSLGPGIILQSFLKKQTRKWLGTSAVCPSLGPPLFVRASSDGGTKQLEMATTAALSFSLSRLHARLSLRSSVSGRILLLHRCIVGICMWWGRVMTLMSAV